LIEQDVEILS